jgi:hypothetical protein
MKGSENSEWKLLIQGHFILTLGCMPTHVLLQSSGFGEVEAAQVASIRSMAFTGKSVMIYGAS